MGNSRIKINLGFSQSITINVNNMLKKIILLYRRFFWSKEKFARAVGVQMGSNNFISTEFWSSEPYLITIGNNCQITAGVRIFTHGGGGAVRKQYPNFDTFGKVKIGNYVYIGNNSMIMPGVSIGDNVLIAAGSVITKSIPSNIVVGGNPAKYICTIEEYMEKNLLYNTGTKGFDQNKKKDFLLSMNESKFIKKQNISIDNN